MIPTNLEESEEHSIIFPCRELQTIRHHYTSLDCSESKMFPFDPIKHYTVLWDWSRGQHYASRSSSWLRSGIHIRLGFCSTYLSLLQTRYRLPRCCHYVRLLARLTCTSLSPFLTLFFPSSYPLTFSYPFLTLYIKKKKEITVQNWIWKQKCSNKIIPTLVC